MCVYVSVWVHASFPPFCDVHSVSVYIHFVFYSSQLSFCVCLCTCVCIGSSKELLWTIVCDLHRPSAADYELITQQWGLRPLCWPLCTMGPLCRNSPLPDPLTSAWANEQAGWLSWGLRQLSFTLSSRWWHLSSSPKEYEGGSSGWML